jgi:hypothetical protein
MLRRVSSVALVALLCLLPLARADGGAPARSMHVGSLDGVWNFATLTPLDRPPELADREFLTDAEAAAVLKQELHRNDHDRRDGSAAVQLVWGLNNYWFDAGTTLARVGGRIRTSLVVDPPDGRVPDLTADAQRRLEALSADATEHPYDGPENRPLAERCLSFNAGPPMLPVLYNNYVQIVETDRAVVIHTEMIHDARIVPLDGRPHLAPAIRRLLGDSRGRRIGATLVVDTTNFTAAPNSLGTDENLHVVERFTRVDESTVLYEFTVDDPTAFVRPWTAVIPMRRSTDRLFEYACHEGNYAMVNVLAGARAAERARDGR